MIVAKLMKGVKGVCRLNKNKNRNNLNVMDLSNIQNESKGMLLDMVMASEAVDSSGEQLIVEGADISDFTEKKTGLVNYEHLGPSSESHGEEIVGRVLYAKKILKKDDCENDRQKFFWDKVECPYIYGIIRLFDSAGHKGAQSLASQIRDAVANGEQILVRASIEGSTLSRNGNKLTHTVCKRLALTTKPCNRTCDSRLLADPGAPSGFEKVPKGDTKDILETLTTKHEHPLYTKLGGSVDTLYTPIIEDSSDFVKSLIKLKTLEKAISAGTTDAAPSALTGGAALQREDPSLHRREHKKKLFELFNKYDKQHTYEKDHFVKYLKAELPECDAEFIDHFANLIDDYKVKLRKAEEDINPEQKINPVQQLTLRGRRIPLPRTPVGQVHFDEKTGTLRTPRGALKMYIPSQDKNPVGKTSFHEIMNDPKVNEIHDKVMHNWFKVHELSKKGKLPSEVTMHSALFSILSANCLDAETEALTQRGWVKGFDLKKDDILLTKNPDTGKLEWQGMTDLKLFPDYEGELVELKSRSFHAITTPDHRWLTTSNRGHVGEKTSITLNSGDKIHRTGIYDPEIKSGLSIEEAAILGWFVTDGYYSRSRNCNGSRNGSYRYEISGTYAYIIQSTLGNPEKCALIDDLLSRVSSEVTSRVEKDGRKTWRLGPRLTKMLLTRVPDRHLTVDSLLDLNLPALISLREAMLAGDGSSWQNKNWEPKRSLTTGRKEQADAFQVLLTLTGCASTCIWRDMSKYSPKSDKMKNIPKMTGIYVVSILSRKYTLIEGHHKRKYTGKTGVWCPVVPNTFFMARRDGMTWCTGNTPVPIQELQYAHLVDSMATHGVDARNPSFSSLRQDWKSRDKPQGIPNLTPEYFSDPRFRTKNDTYVSTNPTKFTPAIDEFGNKIIKRRAGEMSSFALSDNKFSYASDYHKYHKDLEELMRKHGTNTRSFMDDFIKMEGTKGLAQKTGRYMAGMCGMGSSLVPDTHMIRYLFGLEHGKDESTIKYIKNALWSDSKPATDTLAAIDRYYFKNHDAVRHVLESKWGGRFEDPEQAIFPAFWKNWAAIVPHEKARGYFTEKSHNEGTDHLPFWAAIEPHVQAALSKSESIESLSYKTAKLHRHWANEFGELPALGMYYAFLVPQLLESSEKNEKDPVMKAESLVLNLKKAMDDAKSVHHGVAVGGGQRYALLREEPDHYVASGNEGLVKLPKDKLGTHWEIKVPIKPVSNTVVGVDDGIQGLSNSDEQKSLIQSLDSRYDGWTSTPKGMVYIKADDAAKGWGNVHKSVAYYQLAKELGLDKYVPVSAGFRKEGKDFLAVSGIPGSSHETNYNVLKHLGDSGELDKMLVMDNLMGHSRSLNNIRFTPTEMKLVDNGLHDLVLGKPPRINRPSYLEQYGKLKGCQWQGLPIHNSTAEWIGSIDPKKVEDVLHHTGMPVNQISEASRRLKSMQDHLLKYKSTATKGSLYVAPWETEFKGV